MIYVNEGTGAFQIVRPTMYTKRSISFILLDRSAWVEEEFLDIIWKHAGYLVKTVLLKPVYRSSEGWIAHNYDLVFQIGHGLATTSREVVNRIVALIEDEALSNLSIDMRKRTHYHSKVVACLHCGHPKRLHVGNSCRHNPLGNRPCGCVEFVA